MTESQMMKHIQVLAPKIGMRLFRNNVGMFVDKRGIPVSFGLCKGSSDLIGFTVVQITQEMVGQTLPIFTAIEVKAEKGKATKEQTAFLAMIDGVGGVAVLAKNMANVEAAVAKKRKLNGPS